MTEKQLIEKLNMLSDIKPSEDWVVLTKQNILGIEKKGGILEIFGFINFKNFVSSLNLQTKLAYSFAILLIAIVGTVGLAQRAVPGDMLFVVRTVTDKIQLAFIGTQDSSNLDFEVANKRLDELTALVKNDSTQDKTLAINQLKASITDAAKSLIMSSKKNPKAVNDIVAEANKIKESAVLLDIVGNSESQEISDSLYKVIVEEEIKALEGTTLTEGQQDNFKEIKLLFSEEKYSQAFEKILTINN